MAVVTVARYMVGDVRDRLAEIPDGSIDLVLTSPPFLALRSYLPDDHPDKHREIGAEPDPAGFLSTLLGLTAEWSRVLAPHGSICVELGDTYSGSGGAGGDYAEGGLRAGQGKFDGSSKRKRPVKASPDAQSARNMGEGTVIVAGGAGWPLDKSVCGIPHLYALSLAYGRNLLTGEPCDPWRVRNVVAWCRPNPPVGQLGDKFRPATSYLTIATRARRRYFDLDAVRTPALGAPTVSRVGAASAGRGITGGDSGNPDKLRRSHNPAGSPPLDWWEVPTKAYDGSHYAVWPEALLHRPILTMVPERVCTTCGRPSERITEPTPEYAARPGAGRDFLSTGDRKAGLNAGKRVGPSVTASFVTIGWTDCGHGTWRSGVVLDPFAGSGTTLAVAVSHGRDAVGIDLDERNVALAEGRVGMFLEVVG